MVKIFNLIFTQVVFCFCLFNFVSGNGYHVIHNRTYFIQTETWEPWYYAMHECNNINMKLASLESQEKHEIIVQYLQENELLDDYWVSGLKTPGGWFWSSIGEVFSYTAWHDGVPQEPGSCDICLNLVREKWWDVPCTVMYHFICEQLD